jgi:hypothetical protein
MSATSDQVCAKMITAAGNVRTAVNGACANNTRTKYACYSGAGPAGLAYVYWAGAGSVREINGNRGSAYCD